MSRRTATAGSLLLAGLALSLVAEVTHPHREVPKDHRAVVNGALVGDRGFAGSPPSRIALLLFAVTAVGILRSEGRRDVPPARVPVSRAAG